MKYINDQPMMFIRNILSLRGKNLLARTDLAELLTEYRETLIAEGTMTRKAVTREGDRMRACLLGRLRMDYASFVTVVTRILKEPLPDDPEMLRKLALPTKVKDICGQVFFRLTVTGFSHSDGTKTYWTCKCECGNVAICDAYNLIAGRNKSCGCLKAAGGIVYTPAYQAWLDVRKRVGVKVSDSSGKLVKTRLSPRWNSFDSFFEDMGKRSGKRMVVLRPGKYIYCKSNCVWGGVVVCSPPATREVTIGGISAKVWAKRHNVPLALAVEDHAHGFSPEAIIFRRCEELD